MRDRILGLDRETPVLDGSTVTYVNLDNGASSPPMMASVQALNDFMPYYSSVHRGTGFKSRLSTRIFDEARNIIAEFVKADLTQNTVIFGKNASEAINKLAHSLPSGKDCVVITTRMEHHSNDLPWRDHFKVVHVDILSDGRLDEDDFDRKLAQYKDNLTLVAVAGAANVTGYIQPIHRLARKVHEAGSLILIDAAQLAPHREIDMKPDNDPEHLDFVALAGHKMYAPYGTGVLIGPKHAFLNCSPDYSGGGTVSVVTPNEVYWAGLPDKEEAGSPNVAGAVAMAASALALMKYTMKNIEKHEIVLTKYALNRLKEVPGIIIYGENDPEKIDRVGVIPFNIDGIPHALLAAVLGYEGGIGVRSGCFCAHPYVVSLLNLSDEEAESWRDEFLAGDKSKMPGMVRMSLGCYSTTEDVDRLIDMLIKVAAGDYKGDYEVVKETGEYVPKGYSEPFDDYFKFNR
ncbi:MAG: aminotransferase class V-fold PLP-dependent enzyme [Candidatus Sabulitectum sp.]|nr:aminotransferase class V-fold PLP-dependent enzyme [Candidatus Sabulitectum sp.]